MMRHSIWRASTSAVLLSSMRMSPQRSLNTAAAPLSFGTTVVVEDKKGRKHLVELEEGGVYQCHAGVVEHEEIAKRGVGSTVRTNKNASLFITRPTLEKYTLLMPREATPIYPKDAVAVVGMLDVTPGDRVLEAGSGSGAMSLWLARAVGTSGSVVSFEPRYNTYKLAIRNFERWNHILERYGKLSENAIKSGAKREYEVEVEEGSTPDFSHIVESTPTLKRKEQAEHCDGEDENEEVRSADIVREDEDGEAKWEKVLVTETKPLEWRNAFLTPQSVKEGEFDAALIDMMEPWMSLDALAKGLKPSGKAVMITPNIMQIMNLRKVLNMHRPSYPLIVTKVVEITHRKWMVDPPHIARPAVVQHQQGHTGFLVEVQKKAKFRQFSDDRDDDVHS